MPGSRLCLAEREEIRVGLARGESLSQIAGRLGRAASTVSREVSRNGGRCWYRAVAAQQRADREGRRPRGRCLQTDRELCARVAELLDARWSPAPIARYLTGDGSPVSTETIYRELYRPDSMLGDRWRNLCRPRPSRRRRRRTRTGRDPRPLGTIRLVTSRHADLRSEPGHWEGDLLVGAGNRSAVVVLAERVSRYVLLGALTRQTAAQVSAAVEDQLGPLPASLCLSLCWDQGRELTGWPHLETALDTPIYFCEPRSPWQKPLVENTCGLLRRWLHRSHNLYQPQPVLDHIAHTLNTMPRRSLAWHTPHQAWTRLVATAM